MPAGFLGHGSPMNAIEHNRYTDAWSSFGNAVSRPRAILCVSAHWYTNASAVTAMAKPRVIHDFYGFPDELFDFDYPAPGHPEVAELITEIAKPMWVGLAADSWGLDHGTWSVLTHAFPNADIPVVQLSINALEPLEYHLDLGTRLLALREQGVLVVGSGNVVHNLNLLDWKNTDSGEPWNHSFDEALIELLTQRPEEVLKITEHPFYSRAVPTPDHFIPVLYLAGLAAASNETLDVLIEGPAYGSLSMTSYSLGVNAPVAKSTEPAADLEAPASQHPDQSNI